MKRKIQSGFIFSLALLFASCQKESTKDMKEEVLDESSLQKSSNSGGCRMTEFHFYESIADVHSYDNFTYKDGLLDEWTTSGVVLKMEYGASHRMTRSKGYAGSTLLFTVDFVWQNNRLVKEKWYDGPSNDFLGDVVHVYNSKGNVIRTEAGDFGYLVTYNFANNGDMLNFQYYQNGNLFLRADYIYLGNNKNPWLSVTGLELPFFYINSAASMRKRWESSEKLTYYDAFGNPSVYYDLDPTKTIWQMGTQNYFTEATFTNQSNTVTVINGAEFENCNGAKNNNRVSKTLNIILNRNYPIQVLRQKAFGRF